MEKGNWMYLTAPEDLWAKVEDNGVDKEVRVIAIGINQDTSESMAQDDGRNTVLLIADPDNTWYWSSQYIPETPTGSGGNVQAFFFPFNFQAEIDAIIDPAVSELDQEKRKEAYFASQKLVNEQAPVVFLYWDKSFSAVANNLGGFLPTTFNSIFWNANQWYLTE